MSAHALSAPQRRRPLVHDGVMVASIAAVALAWWIVNQGEFLLDARAYWSVNVGDPYAESLVGRAGTYLYSPAFALLMWPLSFLPWPAFAALFSAINLTALVWMAGPPLAVVLLFVPFSPVRDEITTGNIHLLLAAAAVVAFRWPQVWAFPLLTKVTPGVAIAWHAGRREWKALATGLAVTACVVLASMPFTAAAWVDWLNMLQRSSEVAVPAQASVIPGPLGLRVVLALALATVGGWRGWRWTVPAAMALALPVTWSSGLAVLVALLPLYEIPSRIAAGLRRDA